MKMPLLRRKPFIRESTPQDLKPYDEVFFLEITGEVFTDYDAFFERMILCNSLLWTCECTGRSGLTYKEALESEENVRKSVKGIPDPTKRAILTLVHNTKRSKIGNLCDEIYDYVRKRYHYQEEVEVKIKDEWKKGTVTGSPNNLVATAVTPKKSSKQVNCESPKSPISPKGPTLISPVSTIDKKSSWPDPDYVQYEVNVKNKKDEKEEPLKVKGKLIRRQKGSLSKELIRLLVRQTCMRSTPSSDDGYWVVLDGYIAKYGLGKSCIGVGPLEHETPAKFKKKRKRDESEDRNKEIIGEDGPRPGKKRKKDKTDSTGDKKRDKKKKEKDGKKKEGKGDKDGKKKESKEKKDSKKKEAKEKKEGDSKVKEGSKGKKDKGSPIIDLTQDSDTVKEKSKAPKHVMTPEEREVMIEQMKAKKEEERKRRLLEREEEKRKRQLEREEEKQRKKTEKEKEKGLMQELRKLEADFLKEWNKPKEDLKLEDLKPLPEPHPIETKVPQELFGDIMMVLEFVNIFGPFYDIDEELTEQVTFAYLEEALLEHNAEGKYFDLVKYLLKTFQRVTQEENEAEEEDDASTTGTDTPAEPAEAETTDVNTEHGRASASAAAAAAWPMLYQGKALQELTVEPFTLSEILRLHILSSGVKIGMCIGGLRSNWNDWQKRGGFQYSDDPCVDFRHKEGYILHMMQTSSVYDLPASEKLKLLCVLCNQILTLQTTREYIEDAFERVKELKKELRELQHKEHKRRKLEAAEKWRKRMEEAARRKEELERKKKEKLAREGEGKGEAGKGSPQMDAVKDSPQMDGEKEETKESKEGDSTEWVADNSSKPKQKQTKRKGKSKGTEKSDRQEKKVGESSDADRKADGDKECQSDSPSVAKNKETSELKKAKEIRAEEAEEQLKIEEFKQNEQEIIKELARHSAICSENPVGKDRAHKRYWVFWATDGFFIESDTTVNEGLLDDVEDDVEMVENEGDALSKADDESMADSVADSTPEQTKEQFQKVTLADILNLKRTRESICDPLFSRYKCKLGDTRKEMLPKSQVLTTIIEEVQQSVNPADCIINQNNFLWSTYRTKEDIENLTSRLNCRGLRELNLKTTLQKESEQIFHKTENNFLYIEQKPEPPPEEEIAKTKGGKGDRAIDKSLFCSMNDYLEANLRDQILELEDRLWQGSLCVIKVDDRFEWRDKLSKGIEDLLWGRQKSSEENTATVATGEINGDSKEATVKKEDETSKNKIVMKKVQETNGIEAMEVDSAEAKKRLVGLVNGSIDSPKPYLPLKTLPLKFLESENLAREQSRCSTPTSISTPMVNPVVKELANALLLIEESIERKFLKPPLGDDEETRKEKIKEMIQAAKVEFEATIEKNKKEKSKKKSEAIKENGEAAQNGDDDNDDNESLASSASEESKKERTLSERWRSSLASVTNLSQIFIHLDTLERSVMWDKSVLKAGCRICKRKGDAERMLLCDGCDRGFHMYCLKPPLKTVPSGDWFCTNCKPKETKRTNRIKKRTKVEEKEEEEEASLSDDEEASDSEDESEEEGSDDSDDDDDSDENEDSDEENESESGSEEESSEEEENADFCSVCHEEGTLICCDGCPRAFHIVCTYPPMKKVPRGNWSCQVCTGAEDDLPKSKRVKTLEKEREKAAAKNKSSKEDKETPRTSKTAARTQPKSKGKTQGKGRQITPTAVSQKRGRGTTDKESQPNKRARQESLAQSSRGKLKSPKTSKSSPKKIQITKRSSLSGFGRYERRQCSKILEELMQSDDGEPFLLPVDTKEVPDYLKYIDQPIDFQTIKRSLNGAVYDNLDSFLTDVRLVFTNCETYNPPRSNVARAGARLSMYFEQRIRELELVNST